MCRAMQGGEGLGLGLGYRGAVIGRAMLGGGAGFGMGPRVLGGRLGLGCWVL